MSVSFGVTLAGRREDGKDLDRRVPFVVVVGKNVVTCDFKLEFEL